MPTRPTYQTADLVTRAQGGDRDAYDRLFALAADRVLLFIRLRLGSALAAKLEPMDVLQETYTQALESFSRFDYRGEKSFARWLCRIAENRLRGLADYHGALKRGSGSEEGSVTRALERVAEVGTGPVTGAARIELRETLAGALGRLPENEREVLLLRFFQGRELDDIAVCLGRSVSSVRRLIGRATRALGKRIDGRVEESA